jgi:putative transposase
VQVPFFKDAVNAVMGRARRVDIGGMIYHVLNRANFRSRLFKTPAHYQDFLAIVEESLNFVPVRILAYCLMPNHWHMVVHPRADGDLAKFLQRITLTHTQRYHSKTRTVGYGHIYQGRYKSLPVESDSHFLALVRYVERNAKRAAVVKKAYMGRIPRDPFTGSTETWTVEMEDASLALDDSAPPGLVDVHSGFEGTSLEGTPYSSW